MANIKVLQIGKFYHPIPGGIEDHLYNLCNELKDKCKIQVVVSNSKLRSEVSNVEGVKVSRMANFGQIFSTSFCPTMPFWLNKFDSDIIHIHLPNPMAHLSYIIARPKGKLIVMWHSDIIRHKFFLKLYRSHLIKLLKNAKAIIATSPIYINHSSFLNKFKDKIAVIPLGIDTSRFALTQKILKMVSNIRKNFGNRILLFVGRLVYYKGLEYLIESMDEIEANLLIIGKGKLEKKLKKFTQRSLDKNKIYFLGNVSHEEIISYFHACDIFVLPSIERSEAFGIVQLEAMACGKPVISTSLTTGVPWVNQNGITGIVVPPRNPNALAEAINMLIEDPKMREKYGRNGKERVKKEFNKALVAKRVLKLYKEILN